MTKVIKQASVTEKKVSAARAFRLSTVAHTIGETIGLYEANKVLTREEVRQEVENYLKTAMKEDGLTEDMLYKPSKNNPGELYTIIVDSLNTHYRALHGEDLDVRLRDNRMSKIRAFVRDRGAVPLDLFGTFAAKASAEKAKLAVKQAKDAASKVVADAQASSKETHSANEESAPAAPAEVAPAKPNARGLLALQDYLSEFIAQNDEPEISDEMEFVLGACDELLQTINKLIATKQAKAKSKK